MSFEDRSRSTVDHAEAPLAAGVRDNTDYFHQELIKTLAGGDAALLGNLI